MNYDNFTKEQIISILKDAVDTLKEQDKEIERLCNALNEVIERNSKAIEYINKAIKDSEIIGNGELNLSHLLDILQGSDKE